MKRWPEVNINWLMFGKGEMFASLPLNASALQYDSNNDAEARKHGEGDYDLFSQPQVSDPEKLVVDCVEAPETNKEIPLTQEDEPTPPAVECQERSEPVEPLKKPLDLPPLIQTIQTEPQPRENCINESVPAQGVNDGNLAKKRIERIVVFYSDHTFSEYLPE